MSSRRRAPRRRARAALVVALAALSLAPGLVACGGSGKGAETLPKDAPLSFADALPDGARLVVSVQVARALGDKVYGPLLRYALREAAGLGNAPTLGRMVDVAESAESIVVVVGDGPDDLLVVFRHVGGTFEPSAIVADDGRPLFHDVKRSPLVSELAPRSDDGTALFVYPGRVWALARGAARDRARESVAGTRRARTGLVEAEGVVGFAADARAIGRLGLVPRAGGLSQLFGPGLERAEIGLEAEARGLRARLVYGSDDGAARGHEAATRLLEALKRDGDLRTAWLGRGAVARTGREVEVEAKLPEELLLALSPRAGDGPAAPKMRRGAALPPPPEAPDPEATAPDGSPELDLFGGLRKKRTDRPGGL